MTCIVAALLGSSQGWKRARSAQAAVVAVLLVVSSAPLAFASEMAATEAALHDYEWITETVLSLRGEEKARRQERCFYGEDATLQRVPLAPDADEAKRRKAIEITKEDRETLQTAGSRLMQYFVALQTVADSAAADSSLSQAREAHIVREDYPFPGEDLVFEAVGTETRMDVVVGVGATRHSIVSMTVRYTDLNGKFIPNRAAIRMSSHSLTLVTEWKGHKRRS